MHAVAPASGMYLPAEQQAHVLAACALGVSDDLPAWHSVGAVEARPHHDPAGQGVQVLKFVALVADEYVPEGHGVGAFLAGQ